MQKEKRKRGHEASRDSLVSSATPRQLRIIGRKRKMDEGPSHVSLVSGGTSRTAKMDQGPSHVPFVSRGTSRQIRMRIRMREEMVQLKKALDRCKEEFEERFAGPPDQPVSNQSFEEKPFGFPAIGSEEKPFGFAAIYELLDSKIVSLALYDGDNMLFACSGVAINRITTTRPELSRFVTSKRLLTEFEANRNRADKLRIILRLPNNKSMDVFLGLYDSHVAIVTSFCCTGVLPVNPNPKPDVQHARAVALGRAFSSGTLMTTPISVFGAGAGQSDLIPFRGLITEAGLGGPVIDLAGNLMGLSIELDIVNGNTLVLPFLGLYDRLVYLDNFIPNSTNFRDYTLPQDVHSVVPSGFMMDVKYITACGYPKPPPLMLEICGELLDTFEEVFGQLLAYKGCGCNINDRTSGEKVWAKLPKGVVTNISRRVVTLSSYDGDVRAFACTGLLIKWHKNGTPVILTSASLVRSRVDEDKIDENFKIKVFLPPKQVVDGTLELYHSDYNIAVISVQQCLYGIRPENIFRRVKRPRREVVAIGRDVDDGVLMGTIGKVIKTPAGRPSKLNCEDLKLSTCKIKKAGIGGPLVNFVNGSFAGMNFYDRTNRTPYLPRRFIVRALSRVDLPSQRGINHPTDIMGDATVKKNRWPVPKPFWYHPMFDDEPPRRFVGRVLQ